MSTRKGGMTVASKKQSIGKSKTGRIVLDSGFYLLGSVLYALSVNIFSAPNQIAPGGVTGVATLLNYAFHLPIGAMILVINLPLFIAAWRKCGISFTIRTVIVTVLSSVVIDVTGFLPVFHGDKILVALFGGVLAGAGLGLIYMRGATTGGSEIVARLLERRLRHIPIGRLILLVDAMVVIASALVYRQLESALYAMVLIFVSSSVMDALVYGGDSGKMLLIMTGQEELVAKAVLEKMGRGVTMLNATGAYTGRDKRVLLCAVRRSELYHLRTLVQDMDPHAFMIVISTEEVLGQGFKTLDKE